MRPLRVCAFTLVELLVVIVIVGIILAVALPAMAKLGGGNNVKQGGNMVNAYLASARAAAMAAKRHVGVVFYEQSGNCTTIWSKTQTAVQLVMEDGDQNQYSQPPYSMPSGYTVFVPYSAVQYLPSGVRVATLAGTGSLAVGTAENSTVSKTRMVVFNGDGQMEVLAGLACPYSAAAALDSPTRIVFDWNLITAAAAPPAASTAVSSPGVMLFDGLMYLQQTFADDTARAAWIQKNADVVLVNAYTGNVIR